MQEVDRGIAVQQATIAKRVAVIDHGAAGTALDAGDHPRAISLAQRAVGVCRQEFLPGAGGEWVDEAVVVDQKLVMAHVCGHGDFFKHNFMFAGTNRKMLDEMANHATRVRRYMERYGVEPKTRVFTASSE